MSSGTRLLAAVFAMVALQFLNFTDTETIMRKLILGAASVLALGIGGAALDYAADAGDAVPTAERIRFQPPANFSKDDVRQAQLELRNMGLYAGSLDGVVGAETKRALQQFQIQNGLDRTATLDPQTMEALTGNIGVGQGSSMPPQNQRSGSTTNSLGTSDPAAPR